MEPNGTERSEPRPRDLTHCSQWSRETPAPPTNPSIQACHDSVKLLKFADDTTLIGLISNNNESAYRREVDRLVSWCSGNNLELNAQKTVEMIMDLRKSIVLPPPPSLMDSPITSVESFRFLGTTITQDLKWEPTISSLIKKAQQRMYFLRQLRKAKLPRLSSTRPSSSPSSPPPSLCRSLEPQSGTAASHRYRTCTSPELEAGLVVSQLTPLTLHMDYTKHSLRQEAAVHQD